MLRTLYAHRRRARIHLLQPLYFPQLQTYALLCRDHKITTLISRATHDETRYGEGVACGAQRLLHSNVNQHRIIHCLAERHIENAFPVLVADIHICLGDLLSGDRRDRPFRVRIDLEQDFANGRIAHGQLNRCVQRQFLRRHLKREPIIRSNGGHNIRSRNRQLVRHTGILIGIHAS